MSVNRLAFKLPEYAPRTIWTSAQARDVWAPRISRISQVWLEVERLLVAKGVRPATLQNVAPEDLPKLISDMAPLGLVVLPLGRTAKAKGYQSASVPAGDSWDYRCAITKPEHAASWAAAWAKNDDNEIGQLLGYPNCCRAFFQQVWNKERWFDTTWPMVRNTAGDKNLVDIDPGINVLWRWHGLRTVSHLPCSFQCYESIQQGNDALEVMATAYPQEARWLEEILNWPIEWSALHGIAEIKTPITRTSAATDATAEKMVVRYHGKDYPVEGASGLGFPFRQVEVKPLNFKNLSNSRDNGFASHAAMTAAHTELLSYLGNRKFKRVVDLGCGDGLLLSKVDADVRVGVEIDPRVAKLAEKRLTKVIVGDVTNTSWVTRLLLREQPDLVIAQWERNDPTLFNWLNVLSYSYENGVQAKLYTPDSNTHADIACRS